MEMLASGSNFSESTIRKLKKFSLELDVYLALKDLRFLDFKEEKRILIDLNTLSPIEIKNKSQCLLRAYNNYYAYITVGSFSFLVKKSEVIKTKRW